MTLKDLHIKPEYRTGTSNIVNDFFVPLLESSVLYRRAVGFFSSSALIQISKGLSGLLKQGGRMELICSPKLNEDDIKAITKGYEMREIVESALLRNFDEPQSIFEKHKLNIFAHLIANNQLDIKVAFTKGFGMYHEKLGLIYDSESNIVAFSGSINESDTAFNHNYEVLDVFRSWGDEQEVSRVYLKEEAFCKLWGDDDSSITTIDFPQVSYDKLLSYKQDNVDYSIDNIDCDDIDNNHFVGTHFTTTQSNNQFTLPLNISLYNYQNQAIDRWLDSDCRGIFDMATGSGKTFTALGALSKLSSTVDSLGVWIICPYQHLVEQWVEDINAFGVVPLICYSKYPNWDKKLKYLLNDFEMGIKKRYCVVTTNASFGLKRMQELIAKIDKNSNTCFVVDEAHNFGSIGLQKCLKDNFKYRLALSATLERHHDLDGTQVLYDFFGDKCIEFSLKDAIDNGFLTPYKYYPIITTLNDTELDEYIDLTKKIIAIICKKGSKEKLPRSAELLLIKRARLVAGTSNKIQALYSEIERYKDKQNILVYCGATKIASILQDDNDEFESEKRQIDIVTHMLGNELGMKVSQFTSHEDQQERALIKQRFASGELQALIAIKCLDEGVNIPCISHSFILASSTNPKEYVQRRGRVLRKYKDKAYAEIYDFVVMPRDIYDNNAKVQDIDAELSLVKRELERVRDFRKLALNSSDSYELEFDIDRYYNTNYNGGWDYGI
ncbi:MAG: DEAD/DEAH box helicase family protein [Firmicutes bacterium]|nr:DEAD/DEAH box helicase family protein [Bacillota bacterium]MCL1954120.1 DEAD/DEAH box helicase family protein [Bacillota bacterium]